MEYTTIGDTGMSVSRLGLGCMSFGSSDWRDWVLGKEKSREIIEKAIDLGINFFDTANVYSMGESEAILGNTLSEHNRDGAVVATKIHPMKGPTGYPKTDGGGLSRKSIGQAIENSLDRLNMEVVDLYQIHRWDPETSIKETLRALDDIVRCGQARYIGASSMWAHQFSDALHTSDQFNLERFVSMQNHYNLAYREEEREMLPLCEQEGIGVFPWSPLARGYLTRLDESFRETTRGTFMGEDDHYANRIATYRANGGVEINARVEDLSQQKGVTMAQIAIAWLLHKDWVTAPIIGTTSIQHLEDAVEALEICLSDSDIDYLEEPYGPVKINGHG